MPKAKITPATSTTSAKAEITVGQSELAQALVAAIEAAKPVAKKTSFNRKVDTPWTPKDGSKRLKLKRKMYQHGILINEDSVSNEEIDVLNKVRPGLYMDGNVAVTRRKDRGVNITYQCKTAAQRLRLVNQYGIRNLTELCGRIIAEAEAPKAPQFDADGDAL